MLIMILSLSASAQSFYIGVGCDHGASLGKVQKDTIIKLSFSSCVIDGNYWEHYNGLFQLWNHGPDSKAFYTDHQRAVQLLYCSSSVGYDTLVVYFHPVYSGLYGCTIYVGFDSSHINNGQFSITAEVVDSLSDITQDERADFISIPSVISNSFIQIFTNHYQLQLAQIQLFDALGRPQPLPISEVEIPAGENTQKLEIGNLPNGWYMLRIKTKDQVFSRSFLIIR